MQIETQAYTAPDKLIHKVLYAAVTPRPIAWVSTVDDAGVPNLAPYSFFNAVCAFPPTVVFAPGYREQPYPKDTLSNIRTTGEFVVNFVTHTTAAAMNHSAQEVPPNVDEFELAGVTSAPSSVVKPPRVAESPVHFECRLNQIVPVSEQPGGGYLVIGTVVFMHVDDAIFDADKGYIDFDAYDVVGRMAGNAYAYTRDRFNLRRPPSQIR